MSKSIPTGGPRPPAAVEGGLAWIPGNLTAVASIQDVIVPSTAQVAVETDDTGPHIVVYAQPGDRVPCARIHIGPGPVLDRTETVDALIAGGQALVADMREHTEEGA